MVCALKKIIIMNIEGIFAIDKPIGISSQRAVQIVKYWARRQTENKKIKVGHAGTLDPLATGVLVIGIGREHTTKLDTVVASEKEYIADIKLGENSTTCDAEGKKIIVNKNKKPTQLEIEEVLKNFVGNIEQIPPMYSAIKINGQEAYKRVRRGENIEMKKRKINIKKIEILSYEYPLLKINIVCGKGTYIRSLARDIGKNLNTGAYLSGLVRTRVGDFVLADARNMKEFSMRIAIHASELDVERIDGTRVYINELLKRFGDLAVDDNFYIYHRDNFNKSLIPPKKTNYHIKILSNSPLWTQTRFAWDIWREKPDVLWMPLHDMPFLHSPKTKVIATIHDLAFKIFSETFPRGDVRKLNFLTNNTVKRAEHIITVSKATKRDLLHFYPSLDSHNITVVPLGININDWQRDIKGFVVNKTLKNNEIKKNEYLISVGAIQPRKNLKVLIDAFEEIKKTYSKMKLVLVGGNGWLWQDTHEYAQKSKYAKDIVFTGGVSFLEVQILMQNAKLFVFPSLYEGFGIAGLEACAAGLPVVASNNSSIPEVLGNAAEYFNAKNSSECAQKIIKVLNNKELQNQMCKRGYKRAQKFTWDKCAKKTLRVLRNI